MARVYPLAAEDLQIGGLQPARHGDDLDTAHAQHRGRAHRHAHAALHRPVVDEVAVRQRHHLCAHRQWRAESRIVVAAQAQVHDCASAGRPGGGHRTRVEHRAHGHPVHTVREQGLQQPGGVAIGATARVVGAVGDDQRAGGGVVHERLRHGLLDRPHRRVVPVAAVPDRLRHLLRDRLGARQRPGLVTDGHRRADVRDVRGHEAGLHADHVDTGLALEGLGHRQQLRHRPGLGGASFPGARQRGRLPHQALRADASVHRRLHQRGGLLRALVLVDVRIGAVADQSARQAGHALGDVGVQVQRHRDRHVGADHLAQRVQQFAFRVVAGLGHRRAVAGQADPVDAPGGAGGIDDRVPDPGPGLRRQTAGGRGVGRQRRHQVPAVLRGGVEQATDLGARAGEAGGELRALHQPAPPVVLQRRRQHAEGVGLVHELRDQDAVGHRAPLLRAGRGCEGRILHHPGLC